MIRALMSEEGRNELEPAKKLKPHTHTTMHGSTSFAFDPIRLSRLIKTRSAQSVDLEMERYKHWGIIRCSGDDFESSSIQLNDSTGTASLMNKTNREDLQAAVATLRRVNGPLTQSSAQVKRSECVNASTTNAVHPAGRRHNTAGGPVPSLLKTGDRRTLEAMAQMAQRLPKVTSFSKQATARYDYHIPRSESTRDASYLLYLSSLMEGTNLVPHVETGSTASSVSTLEYAQHGQDKRVVRESDTSSLFLFLFMAISCWYVVSTNVFIEPFRRDIKHHPTVAFLHQHICAIQSQTAHTLTRQALLADVVSSRFGDMPRPWMLVRDTILGFDGSFQPPDSVDEEGWPENCTEPDLGSRCKERVNTVTGLRQDNSAEIESKRHSAVDDGLSSPHLPTEVPTNTVSRDVLLNATNDTTFVYSMHSKVLTFETSTFTAAKEDSLLMTLLPQECDFVDLLVMCPIATWIKRTTIFPLAASSPVSKSEMTLFRVGLQSTPVNAFVGDVWRCLRHRLPERTAIWIEEMKRKEGVGGFFREWKRLCQSMLFLSERIKSVGLQFLDDSRKDCFGKLGNLIGNSRQRVDKATHANSY